LDLVKEEDLTPNEFLLFDVDPSSEGIKNLSKKDLKKLKIVYRYKVTNIDGIIEKQ
jgi:hypothetical protein